MKHSTTMDETRTPNPQQIQERKERCASLAGDDRSTGIKDSTGLAKLIQDPVMSTVETMDRAQN